MRKPRPLSRWPRVPELLTESPVTSVVSQRSRLSVSVCGRTKAAGEKEQGARGEVSLGRRSGLTQRSLEVGDSEDSGFFCGLDRSLWRGFSVEDTYWVQARERVCEGQGGCCLRDHLEPPAPQPTRLQMPTPEQGSPTSGLWTSTSCQISGSLRLEIKCTVNVTRLNHPQTIPFTPSPWTNCLPRNRSLVPKSWGPLP